MLVFNDVAQPVILDNIYTPTTTDYIWVLDLNIMDFTLSPLVMLEETICPSMQLIVRGFEFVLPANWNILVYDQETSQLDVVELAETAGREFTAFVYGPTRPFPIPAVIQVTNYFLEYRNVGPSLNKHQLLCYPVGPTEWCVVGPSDNYVKHLRDKTVGDLIGS